MGEKKKGKEFVYLLNGVLELEGGKKEGKDFVYLLNTSRKSLIN